jgi:hypothetical protein
LALTEEGQHLFEHAQRILAEIDEAEAALMHGRAERRHASSAQGSFSAASFGPRSRTRKLACEALGTLAVAMNFSLGGFFGVSAPPYLGDLWQVTVAQLAPVRVRSAEIFG